MYLNDEQIELLGRLLKTFFTLPYSTDLDGKDAETLLRIVKQATGRVSRRKELFDIVDGTVGYSVKTLSKSPSAVRVDLQEQRFCDVAVLRRLLSNGGGSPNEQGQILLTYMANRIREQMAERGVKIAKSLILLKHWNRKRTKFEFRYWEEDFQRFIDNLYERNSKGEIEWVVLRHTHGTDDTGLHGRDRMRLDKNGMCMRLIRMHYKHNQIFTDHDIPDDAAMMTFDAQPISWQQLADLLDSISNDDGFHTSTEQLSLRFDE